MALATMDRMQSEGKLMPSFPEDQRSIFEQLSEMIAQADQLDSEKARKFFRFVIEKVNPWLKPYVYAILDKTDRLKRQYILSLDSDSFSGELELRNLIDIHIQKLEDALRVAQKAQLEDSAQIHAAIANLLLSCMQTKEAYLLETIPAKLANLFDTYLPNPDVFSNPVLAVFAKRATGALDIYGKASVLVSSMAVADINVGDILEAVNEVDRSELARQLIRESSITTLNKKAEQFFLVFDNISAQSEKIEIFDSLFLYRQSEVTSLDLMEWTVFIRKYLDHISQTQEERTRLLSRVFSRLLRNGQALDIDGPKQLACIGAVTDVKEEQAAVFWQIGDVGLRYPPEAKEVIEGYLSFCPTNSQSEKLIFALKAQDLLGVAALKEYITRFFLHYSRGSVDLQYLLRLAEKFSVEARVFQELATGLIKVAIQNEDSFVVNRELASRFGIEEVASEKRPFSDPLHAEINYGGNSWRSEQSVIDPMQNALDAQAHAHSLRLVDILHPPDKNDPAGYYTTPNIAEAWLLQQKILCLPADSEELAHIDPEIIKKIDALNKVKPPKLLVLVRGADLAEYKIPVEELYRADKKDLQVIGFEIIDQGIGYARELNSHFAPTKANYPFLRGRFGQGTKMSIIALTRMGCQVDIGSRSIDLQSHKVSEWRGSTVVKSRGDDDMVYFEGEENSSYSVNEDFQTGTTFSVRFPENTTPDNLDIQKIADMLSAESISEYILDFHPLENSYILPAMHVDGRVSTHDDLLGKLWVQGLEVPKEVEMQYAKYRSAEYLFSYDFSTVAVFSGKDRKYLNRDVADKIVKSIWKEMTDHGSLVNLYSKIVSLSGLKSNFGEVDGEECYEATDMVSDLNIINAAAREAHKKACLQVLGASENDKFICLVGFSQEFTQEESSVAKELGYTKRLEFMGNTISADYIMRVLGKENTINESELREKINARLNIQKVDTEHPKELVAEVQSLVEQAQQMAATELFSAFGDPRLLSEKMNKKPNIYFSNNANPVWLPDDMGGIFNTMISLAACGITVGEDGLTHSQKQVLFLESFVAFCALGGRILADGSHASKRAQASQETFNELLRQHAHNFGFGNLSEEIGLKHPEKTLLPAVKQLVSERYEKQSEEREFVPIANFLLKLKNSQDIISKSIFENLFINMEPQQLHRAMRLARNLDLVDSAIQFAEGKFAITSRRLPGKDTDQFVLEEVRRELVGTIGALPVYLEGKDNLATLVVPFDFSTTDKALILVGKDRVAVSKFITTPPFPHSLNASIASFFDKDYFDRCAYAADGEICFPIGSYDESSVVLRTKNFLKIDMVVSAENTTQEIDPNQGKTSIDINASTEYGEGDIWDSAVRMLSEAWQNSKDAGGPAINFQVDGLEFISEEQLLSAQYQNAVITGFVFSDQGKGYTTKGLQEWNNNSKRDTGKNGRYGEGLKMFTISAARNKLLLRCRSRNWSATATTKNKEILAMGLRKTIEVPSFNLDWSETDRVGSTLELSVAGEEAASNTAWQRILKIIDPRKEVDAAGNRGLSRYCRDLRENEEGVVSIGPVSILTGEGFSKDSSEESHVYERGLVIPNLVKGMDINLLFGIDIADSIISTQERNRVDKSVFFQHLEKAYRQAPYELCVTVFKKLKEHLDNSLPLNYLEFSLISKVEDEQKLAAAFFEVFGKNSVLGTSEKFVERASRQGAVPRIGAIVESLPNFKIYIQHSIAVVDFNKKELQALQEKLVKVVPSTFDILSELVENETSFEEEKKQLIHEKVAQIAGELLVNFNTVLESEYGKILFRDFISGKASENYPFQARNKNLNPVEQAKEFLALLASGSLKLNLDIIEYELKANAFVDGVQNLSYSAATVRDSKKFVATTIHELLHLAFRVVDYNHTFMSLLLASNRPLLSKILASVD